MRSESATNESITHNDESRKQQWSGKATLVQPSFDEIEIFIDKEDCNDDDDADHDESCVVIGRAGTDNSSNYNGSNGAKSANCRSNSEECDVEKSGALETDCENIMKQPVISDAANDYKEGDLEKGGDCAADSTRNMTNSEAEESDASDLEKAKQHGSAVLPSPNAKSDETQKLRCCNHPRVKELYLSADWWTLWIGLASFALVVAIVFLAVPLMGSAEKENWNWKYVLPQPKKWRSNPLDAWDLYNLIGVPCLLSVLCLFYVVALKAMGKLDKKVVDVEKRGGDMTQLDYDVLKTYVAGFVFVALIATVSMWVGSNIWCASNGLGYAVFSILLGMVFANAPQALVGERFKWVEKTAKDGEFFIKCSLVLLAVELNVLIEVGGPAFLVAWIGSPLAIIAGFVIGTRLFGCKDSLAMLISVGAAWCGASAISAVAPVVGASSEDVALAISVVAFFTVIFTFVQPYIAIFAGIPENVAGAWIGGSVDQTGNVIVSAAIISEQATEVAGIVKMVLNAGMGVMASVIACYWGTCRTDDNDEGGKKSKFSMIMLWDKFPKFTLGFIITSAILTVVMQHIEETIEAEALPGAVSSLNQWWFAIAFVGIGLTTNIKKLFGEAWKSGIIQVYLIANAIDILLALGLAYSVY